ncbi:hypothetical protein [[Phormidium ambiguum] IAM M-71]|nr:hypothetical protein [Phormidium ambiguum]
MMKRISKVLAIFLATIAILAIANTTLTNLSVPTAQAQEAIEESETPDSNMGILRRLPGNTVEVKTPIVQPNNQPNSQAQNADLACNNANFNSSTFGGFLSPPPDYRRNDKRPNNYSAFKSDCLNPAANGECWGQPRYQLYARYNNIKEWRGKICSKSVQNAYNNHVVSYRQSNNPSCPIGGQKYCQTYYGPVIGFQVKGHNEPENKWRYLESNGKLAAYEIPANQTKMYNWAWKTSQPSDFRLVVRYAKLWDEFDLMMDK